MNYALDNTNVCCVLAFNVRYRPTVARMASYHGMARQYCVCRLWKDNIVHTGYGQILVVHSGYEKTKLCIAVNGRQYSIARSGHGKTKLRIPDIYVYVQSFYLQADAWRDHHKICKQDDFVSVQEALCTLPCDTQLMLADGGRTIYRALSQVQGVLLQITKFISVFSMTHSCTYSRIECQFLDTLNLD